jgi:hypothetical protein
MRRRKTPTKRLSGVLVNRQIGDLIAAVRAVGIVAIRRIAEATETVAKFAMFMAAMETTEVSGHVAATEAAAKMTAAETASMSPSTTTAASECAS